jgi:hypothetical protein
VEELVIYDYANLNYMKSLLFGGLLLFAALPSTTNYQLQSFGFGSGGTANTYNSTYSLEGTSGEIGGLPSSTTNYKVNPGFIQTQQANVPQLSALDNNGGILYNQLHFVINTQNNPTDATYLVSVSKDNFVTNITYVQPDGTLSTTLSTSDYQTYTYFGSSTGSYIVGLTSSTTYYVKVLVTNGKFSESQYGPISSVATASPSISFNLDTSTHPVPPIIVNLGSLVSGTINTSSQTIDTSETTNAAAGGNVYITGQNGGLHSASSGNQISSASADLSVVNNGFGGQNSSTSQTSGGPWNVSSPYNGSGNNVGKISTTTSSLYNSTSPITGGLGSIFLKAKSRSTDIAATDYTETITFTAAASF